MLELFSLQILSWSSMCNILPIQSIFPGKKNVCRVDKKADERNTHKLFYCTSVHTFPISIWIIGFFFLSLSLSLFFFCCNSRNNFMLKNMLKKCFFSFWVSKVVNILVESINNWGKKNCITTVSCCHGNRQAAQMVA